VEELARVERAAHEALGFLADTRMVNTDRGLQGGLGLDPAVGERARPCACKAQQGDPRAPTVYTFSRLSAVNAAKGSGEGNPDAQPSTRYSLRSADSPTPAGT